MRIADFVRLEEVFDNHDFLVDGGEFGSLERITDLRREDYPGIYTRNNTYRFEGVALDKILVCHNSKLHKLSDVFDRFKAQVDTQNQALESLHSELRTAQQLVIESGKRIAELEAALDAWVMGD